MSKHTAALVVGILVVILSIIHLGVGIGLTARYSKYKSVLQLSYGLAAYNIVIGFFGLAVGALAVFAVLKRNTKLCRPLAILCLALGIATIASFITGLVINSQSIDDIKDRLTYRMSTYNSNQDSITIFDGIQTDYECCGVNLWLDWSSVQLGVTSATGTSFGRRRREKSAQLSAIIKSLKRSPRRRRQVVTSGSNIYNLPSVFGFKLPLSCCTNGGSSDGTSLGGYCQYNTSLSTDNFYVEGCLPYVANVSVSQVTGIVVINTCLSILAVVFLILLLTITPVPDPNDPNNKQLQQNEAGQQQQQPPQQQMQMQYQPQAPLQYQQTQQLPYTLQQQQYQYGQPNQGYYMDSSAPAYYYGGNPPAYSGY
ncbi:unnamed protein product [Adineta ricciae]|uniref:Tetraspanin n=1 Tax=Adineta ricciae TaxID=249248 RepID=A0A814LPW4_ADIRI|nr:unnamed protein product [Adineta ricciae]CAF1161596.1 unnamed protein product [Adineta ricciae]